MSYFTVRFSLGLVLWLISASVQASKCLIQEAMTDPALTNNTQFWVEYSQLAARGSVSQQDMLQLARRHNPQFARGPSSTTHTPQVIPTRAPVQTLSHHKRATSDIEKLQPSLRRRYNVFLETIQGPQGTQAFRNNPGSWNMERLPQFGPDAYSVRLNGDVRVLFDLRGSEVVVREVNRERIHNR